VKARKKNGISETVKFNTLTPKCKRALLQKFDNLRNYTEWSKNVTKSLL